LPPPLYCGKLIKKQIQVANMKLNFFNSNYEARCSYCQNGRNLKDSDMILCPYMGVMTLDSYCKKFKYDHLKRIPKRIPRLPKFDQKDFEI
jgi:hypothetical protein